MRAFESEAGCQFPLGETGKFIWDPAGFAKNEADFQKYRAAEIKHGRVAMIAVVGLVTQHYFHFNALSFPDAYLSLSDVPNGFAAIGES